MDSDLKAICACKTTPSVKRKPDTSHLYFFVDFNHMRSEINAITKSPVILLWYASCRMMCNLTYNNIKTFPSATNVLMLVFPSSSAHVSGVCWGSVEAMMRSLQLNQSLKSLKSDLLRLFRVILT